MSENFFRLPGVNHRISILGRTGSGKTQFGFWYLSKAPFHLQPYIVVDYKGETMLRSLDRVREIGLNEPLPKHPGLYCVRPLPSVDDDAMNAWLWKVHAKGRTGLFFDEGYSVPDRGALEAVITQGRSLRIPVVTLSQRPAWLSRFVFSEADFFSVFQLSTIDDRKKLAGFMPDAALSERSLPKFHSQWYDVSENRLVFMRPVPDADEILDAIETRIAPRRRLI